MRINKSALYSLTAGNFAIGTGTIIVVGILSVLSDDLQLSPAATGQLVTAGALTTALTAPLLAQALVRFQRHHLLMTALLLFALSQGLAALAGGLGLLLAMRVLGSLSAAVHTPQAAGTAGALADTPAGKSKAVSTAFIGWSLANVLGVPLGAYLAGVWGWRAAFVFVALLNLLAFIWQWRALPRGMIAQALPEGLWSKVLAQRHIMTLLTITVVQSWGQFTAFTYIAPLLKVQFQMPQSRISMVLAAFGFFGLLGNIVATRWLNQLSAQAVAKRMLIILFIGLGSWAIWAHSLTLIIAIVCWGFACFAINGMQQAQLLTASPLLAPVSLALNTSALYLGQGLGSATGALIITLWGLPSLLIVASLWVLVAIAIQHYALR
ncbi:MAG: Purine efflux pump PbuE [Pseudomonadota bacterium]|jgi:predicted MFS family arabinose efflux permease